MTTGVTDIETIYRDFGPMVLRRCRRLLGDESKAQDAMHDVFVNVLRRKGRLHWESPAGLLLTAATRVCLNRLRSERRHPEDSVDELLLDALACADDASEARSIASRCLARLFGNEPETTGTLAVLVYVDGCSVEEAARHVGLSPSGVHKRLRSLRGRVLTASAPAVWPGSLSVRQA